MVNRIPNVNTFADLLDRLIIEVNKLSYFENRKREEHLKKFPDNELIVKLDHASRNCCELRSVLKNEINKLLGEILESGEYKVLEEPRTFKSSPKRITDVLAEMCEERARSLHNGELVEAIERDFNNG